MTDEELYREAYEIVHEYGITPKQKRKLIAQIEQLCQRVANEASTFGRFDTQLERELQSR
jgi:adenine-specific DNA methylase